MKLPPDIPLVSSFILKTTFVRRLARCAISISLATLCCAAYAATSSSNLFFSASGQNLWGSGGATPLSYNDFLGLSWGDPYPKDYYKYYDFEVGDVWGATSGKIGVELDVNGTAGSMALQYPMQVNLTFPDTDSLYAGSTFTIGSSFSALASGYDITTHYHDKNGNLQFLTFNTGAPILQTLGPSIYASLDAIMDIKAQFSGSLPIVGSLPIIGPDIQETYNILKVDPAQGDKIDLIPNILSGYAQAPDLNSQSSGLTGDSLESSMRDSVGGLNLNIVNLITQILGMPPLSGNALGVVDYNLFSAGIGLALDIQQAFDFIPRPLIHLDFTSPVDVWVNGAWQQNVTSVEFHAGDSVTLRAPNAYDLGVKPTIRLDNTTTNSTDAIISGRLDMSALGLAVPSLDFSVGPLIHPDPYKLDLASFDLYDSSFNLNTGPSMSANVFNIGFKNRYNDIPLGNNLVSYCSLNPQAPGCSGIDFSDLSWLDPCILDPAAGQCASLNFRMYQAADFCVPLGEGQACFQPQPELYRVNADCDANNPLDCLLHELIGSVGDALWDENMMNWVFSNSGFVGVDGISLGEPSTDEQLLQRFASLGYNPDDYQIRMPEYPVPEPDSLTLSIAGLLCLDIALRLTARRPT